MLSVHQIIETFYTQADTEFMLTRNSCWIKSRFNFCFKQRRHQQQQQQQNENHDYVHLDNRWFTLGRLSSYLFPTRERQSKLKWCSHSSYQFFPRRSDFPQRRFSQLSGRRMNDGFECLNRHVIFFLANERPEQKTIKQNKKHFTSRSDQVWWSTAQKRFGISH